MRITGTLRGECGDGKTCPCVHDRMDYDPAGAFRGAWVVPEQDVSVYAALRDLLWHVAEPFPAWWARHPEHHREGAYPT